MHHNRAPVKTALLSVSNKSGLIKFAQKLHQAGIHLISTGGTAKELAKHHIPHQLVSDLTGFPEIMDGRVKTLHPKIHGGILGKRDKHQQIAEQQAIEWIDLVVCNLYPFVETIQAHPELETALENIDIGGPTLIRAAAKNLSWTSVVIDPDDYQAVWQQVEQQQSIDFITRQQLAAKAFAHTAYYDSMIQHYLSNESFPDDLNLSFKCKESLRYGENPHQQACLYQNTRELTGLLAAQQLHGKPMSFNNYVDANSALLCLKEFTQPTCVVVKHANPCGVATAQSLDDAFKKAFEADSRSAFGGIIALNQPCSDKIAQYLSQVFVEIIIAPDFAPNALELLCQKKNVRLLKLVPKHYHPGNLDYKTIIGGLLVQTTDTHSLNKTAIRCVTEAKPTDEQWQDLLFSWQVVKQIKSNAILFAKNQTTVGIGAGQVSRIDSVQIALQKAGDQLEGCVLASDAFFPFRDSIDRIANTGVTAIIQPGGSKRDQEVIEACNEHKIAMVFTGVRCFNH